MSLIRWARHRSSIGHRTSLTCQYLPGSFTTGQRRWAFCGAISATAGIAFSGWRRDDIAGQSRRAVDGLHIVLSPLLLGDLVLGDEIVVHFAAHPRCLRREHLAVNQFLFAA